jgi:hypothetical protein
MELGSAEICKLIAKVKLGWLTDGMNQTRMLDLKQKWTHLKRERELRADGDEVEKGAADWLHDMERRAKTLMGQARIDQKKEWIIDKERNAGFI